MYRWARAVVRRSYALRERYKGDKKSWARRYREAVKRGQEAKVHQAVRVFGRRYLRDFFSAADEAGVRPFLMWGTLLGCIREGVLLKHDRDIDLGMLAADYALKDALIAAMRRRGYRLVWDKGCKFKFDRPNLDVLLDVDVFFPWQNMVICASPQDDGRCYAESFPANAFDRLRRHEFLRLSVLVPDPPERVLETIYRTWQKPVHAYSSRRDPFEPIAGPCACLSCCYQ